MNDNLPDLICDKTPRQLENNLSPKAQDPKEFRVDEN
jgi:hypothetical protein